MSAPFLRHCIVLEGSVLALRTTDPPGQKVVEVAAETVTVGKGVTVTAIVFDVAEQPLLVTVTV